MEMEMDGALEGFDVDAYAAKYSGRNRVNRLLFLAQHVPPLRRDAHLLLLEELKNGMNMKLYLEVAEAAAAHADDFPRGALDVNHIHVENVKCNAEQQRERLEQELSSYKSSMIKESIRMGFNDLGEFYFQLGDLPSALKSFAQARDYCTTDKHIVEMCLNVSKVGLYLNNYGYVRTYMSKMEQVATTQSDPILKSKLSAGFGLVALHERRYRDAALRFIECHVDIGSSFNDVLHAEDIALYGGMCALASFSREELKERVIANVSFKAFLELLPWLRELINDFYSSNYASCLKALAQMKPEMRVDMHLSEHVEALSQEIRSRTIIQFFYPYLSVDLNQMAAAFSSDVAELEKEVCQLIKTGKINARVDSCNKVLYAYQPNKRTATYKRALDVGRKYVAESRSLLLRMSLLKNNVVVHDD